MTSMMTLAESAPFDDADENNHNGNDDDDDDDKDLVSCLPHELLCLLSPNGWYCYHPTNFVSHHLDSKADNIQMSKIPPNQS